MGTYNYTAKVDGANTNTPSGITVKVLDGPRETPVKSVSVLPASIKVAPPGSATLVAIVSPSNTTFSPDKDCTRGQIVTFLYRCMK